MILDTAVNAVLKSSANFVISTVFNLFFPPSPLDYDLIWTNIKARVEALCKELISDEYAYQLELRL